MRECSCVLPVESVNPRRPNTCAACGLRISPEWSSTDENTREFFRRLGEGLFPYNRQTGELMADKWYVEFQAHCERRERAGREIFGLAFHRRDNPLEAMEEAADGAIYMLLDTLKQRREGRGDEDIDVILTAAKHFALAHKYLAALRAKRRHTPGV